MFRYVGNGSFMPGYPARDMEDDELELFDLDAAIMLASGLYEYEEPESENPEGLFLWVNPCEGCEGDCVLCRDYEYDDLDEYDNHHDLCDDCYNSECEEE